MKVQITDSFTKSLKRLIWHQHWLYRTYALFRYDIPLFVKNVWRFRSELWDHQWLENVPSYSMCNDNPTIDGPTIRF